ncbi:MAG: hypothetical protein ACFFCM_05880 [Promethearchaeota archaeon]
MGKKELFRGTLSGTVTLPYRYSFIIKLNEEIEGLPKEFLVAFSTREVRGFLLRKGDIVTIGGTVIQNFVGIEQLENIFMKAYYVYNTTLKIGAGLKIKKKEVFNGKLSGIATSDLIRHINGLESVFSIKLDKEIEGIPNEFVVYKTGNFKILMKKRDKLLIEGTLFQGNIGKNEFSFTEMKALHAYNIDLKCGG